jgi:hypothetical protein
MKVGDRVSLTPLADHDSVGEVVELKQEDPPVWWVRLDDMPTAHVTFYEWELSPE